MEDVVTTNLHILVEEDKVRPQTKPGPLASERQRPDRPTDSPPAWKTEIWWLIGMAILGIAGSLFAASRLDPILFQRHAQDTWFDADVSRVLSDMSSRTASHFRTNVHPLFSLLVYPVTALIEAAFGISAVSAVAVVLALATGVLLATFFLLLRLLGCRRLDAFIFALLLATTASTIFWSAVPDTFLLGSLSILTALCLAAVAARRRVFEYWFVIVSALTLSFTTTNWMAGIATTFAHHRWRRALQVTANAFVVVVILWGLENTLFEGVNFFFVLRSESQWILPEGLHGWPAVAKVFFFHSIVMPEITVANMSATTSVWPVLTIQKSSLASGGILALPAIILWTGLLVTGLYALVTRCDKPRFRMVVSLVLASQLGLHLLYGRETFLFAPHFVPLLVLVVALGTLTRARRMILVAAIALIACCAYNNVVQFGRANQHIHSFSQPREAATTSVPEMGRVNRDEPKPEVGFEPLPPIPAGQTQPRVDASSSLFGQVGSPAG